MPSIYCELRHAYTGMYVSECRSIDHRSEDRDPACRTDGEEVAKSAGVGIGGILSVLSTKKLGIIRWTESDTG